MVAAHALGGRLQRFALDIGQAVKRGLELGRRQLQRRQAVRGQAVEALRVFEHGGIAALLHIGQDVGHALLDRCIGIGRPMQAGLEGSFKIGTVSAQTGGRGFHLFQLQ
ncbi:hypothetical protein D3C71_1942350 [compost metagenome]